MATQFALHVAASIRDTNVGADGQFQPFRHVERLATFTLTVSGQDDDATLEAIFVGETGKSLTVREVTRDDLNLSPAQANKLVQAIYEGHYESADHDRPVRQSHLRGELNVEPYWEQAILARFDVPSSNERE